MSFAEFNLTNSVLISEQKDTDLDIASFNPKQDTITNANIMLDMPSKQIVLDQSRFNSCVGHSLVMCSSLLHYKKTNKWINFDPYMVYGTVKKNQWSGQGMYPTEAIDNCINDGFYFRRDFNIVGERPYITKRVEDFKAQHPDLVNQAKDYALTGRATMYNWKTVKQSLELGMPVSATWALYKGFFDNTGDDGVVLTPNTTTDKFLGNHQMTIVGIRDDNKYIVVNSYGEQYGFKGVYFIPFNYSFTQAFSVSDTIIPAKYKARKIIMKINDPKMIVDDNIITSDVSPVILDDRTLIPARILSESLGASVEWLPETQTVIVRSEEALIKLQIGSNEYTVDGYRYKMDTHARIINDRTFIPARFISEALNCDVSWNQLTQEVIIKCL